MSGLCQKPCNGLVGFDLNIFIIIKLQLDLINFHYNIFEWQNVWHLFTRESTFKLFLVIPKYLMLISYFGLKNIQNIIHEHVQASYYKRAIVFFQRKAFENK